MRITHAIGISLLAGLCLLVLWQQTITGIELEIINFLAPSGSLATTIALGISALTRPITVVVVMILAGLFAAYEHHAKLWWLFSLLLLAATAASGFLKEIFAIPRPEEALVVLSSFGFPSTHATVITVMLVVGLWFYHWWQGGLPIPVILITTFGWLAVCLSRLVLNVHSQVDILAGVVLGLALSSVAISIAPQIFERYRIQKTPR